MAFTTLNQQIISGRIPDLPISYSKRATEKFIIDEDKLWEYDILSFDSKVGFITNCSSTLHCMKQKYSKDSDEYKEIERRLKIFRLLQGEAIDSAKNGGISREIPGNWSKYDKDENDFTNSLVADSRPMFMRFLYPHYSKKYHKELKSFDNSSWSKFGKPFEDLLFADEDELSEEELNLVNWYYKTSFFLHNPSEMNRISRYMQKKMKMIKADKKEFDHRILLSPDHQGTIQSSLDGMTKLFKKYRSLKSSISKSFSPTDKNKYKNIDQVISDVRKEAYETISSNSSELADVAIILTYGVMKGSTKAFAWNVFGEEIVENLKNKLEGNTVYIPFPSSYETEFDYLYRKYKMTPVQIEKYE